MADGKISDDATVVPAAADFVPIIKSGANKKATIDGLLGRVFYPESYGAVGDGTTDDTVAIQAAIDAAGATGGTVVFRAGSTYKLTPQGTVTGDSLTTPYCLLINAAKGDIALEGNGAKLFLADTQASNSILLLIRGSSGTKRTKKTTVRGLEFYSNPATQTAWTDFAMLEVAYADNVTIERCYFHDSPFMGCQVFRGSENSLFRENRVVYSTYGNGYRLEILTGRVLNNVFEGDVSLTKSCLDLSCNSDVTIQGERIHVLGNLFKSGYQQIVLSGQRGTVIANNVLYGATNSNGIAISVSHYSHVTTPYSCTDCMIANNIIYGARQGIIISGTTLNGVSGLMVLNNQIVEDTSLVNLTTGISEQNTASVLNNMIIGNRIIGATTGISAAGAPANGTLVRDNLVDTTFGGHTHVAADIPNLDAAKITTGTMATARLGSGTADSTSFLRGDQTYAVPAGGFAAQVFRYTSTTTITPPTGWTVCRARVLGSGGGGGSGRRGAAGTARSGGTGGSAGAITELEIRAADLIARSLTGNWTLTVGTSPAGGAARTADDTDGASGTAGNLSKIEVSATVVAQALGGGAGAGGGAVNGTGGGAPAGQWAGSAGGATSVTAGATNGASGQYAGGGGAGGGSITTGDAVQAPAVGGSGGRVWDGGTSTSTGGASGTSGVSPTAGGVAATSASGRPGGGGGGGGSSISTAAAAGGAGVTGGGGGGGGASLNGNNSGAGGAGGAGMIELTWS